MVWFEQGEDGNWAEVTKEAICGTIDPDDPTAYPDDALVTEELWQQGCVAVEEGTTSAAAGDDTCDADAFEAIFEDMAAQEDEELVSLDSVSCEEEFAFAAATLSTADGEEYQTRVWFEQDEDGNWAEASGEEICGTIDPDDDTAYPDDALVSEDLWQEGCVAVG